MRAFALQALKQKRKERFFGFVEFRTLNPQPGLLWLVCFGVFGL